MSGKESLRTNRDLYLFIADLCGRSAESARSLETYLCALWHGSMRHRDREEISLSCFAALLEEGFREPPPALVAAPPDRAGPAEGESGFAHWESTILSQIRDLREMHDAGTLANELRYFGVNAPRGSRWYNFDPLTFLECAAAGTFDGWRAGDPTDRDYVAGPVAVLDSAGNITSADPRSLEESLYEIEAITWDRFADFLEAGQWYE